MNATFTRLILFWLQIEHFCGLLGCIALQNMHFANLHVVNLRELLQAQGYERSVLGTITLYQHIAVDGLFIAVCLSQTLRKSLICKCKEFLELFTYYRRIQAVFVL